MLNYSSYHYSFYLTHFTEDCGTLPEEVKNLARAMKKHYSHLRVTHEHPWLKNPGIRKMDHLYTTLRIVNNTRETPMDPQRAATLL